MFTAKDKVLQLSQYSDQHKAVSRKPLLSTLGELITTHRQR